MHFAIPYRLRDSSVGGGHTYEESILLTMIAQVGATRHRLTVLGIGSGRRPNFEGKNVSYIHLGIVSSAIVAIAALFRRHRWHPFVGMQRSIEYFMQMRVAKVLRSEGVQFVWSLSPFIHTMELPFAVTVWDIEYRRQGFFPEISAAGEWRNREGVFQEMLHRAAYVIASNEIGLRQIEFSFAVLRERIISLPHFTPRWILENPEGKAPHFAAQEGLKAFEYILYPAQFWPHKNHIRILEAVAQLKRQRKSARKIVFVGSDQGNLTYIKNCVREMGLISDVIIPGFVSQAELAWLYRNAFCLVYASMFGPENLPPLEAFGLGCPVICASYEGASEQYGDAALYFEATSHIRLVNVLEELENPRTRSALINKGLIRAQIWTPRMYVAAIFDLLEKIEPTLECWL